METMMMNGGMSGGMMMLCMAAVTLFALVAVVALVWQVVLQQKLLQEVRRLRAEKSAPGRT